MWLAGSYCSRIDTKMDEQHGPFLQSGSFLSLPYQQECVRELCLTAEQQIDTMPTEDAYSSVSVAHHPSSSAADRVRAPPFYCVLLSPFLVMLKARHFLRWRPVNSFFGTGKNKTALVMADPSSR